MTQGFLTEFQHEVGQLPALNEGRNPTPLAVVALGFTTDMVQLRRQRRRNRNRRFH